jgi:hypothetical protein
VKRKLHLALISFVVCLLVASLASGQPRPAAPTAAPSASASAAPPPRPSLSESLTGEAKADYDLANLLLQNNDPEKARLKYESAYAISKDPRLLWNIAACEKQLKHYAKTVNLVKRYVAEDALISAEDKAEADRLLGVIEPLTAKLAIVVKEPEADVYVDGDLVGKSPLAEPLLVDIGTRKIRVTKIDFKDFEKDVPVGGAALVTVEAPLEAIPKTGKISITAQTDAAIFLDGKAVGTGSFSGPVTAGSHKVRVTAEDMLPYEEQVEIERGGIRSLQVSLEPEPSGFPYWLVIVGGVVVAGGVGIAIGFAAQPDDPLPPSGTFGVGHTIVEF